VKYKSELIQTRAQYGRSFFNTWREGVFGYMCVHHKHTYMQEHDIHSTLTACTYRGREHLVTCVYIISTHTRKNTTYTAH